MPRLRGLRLERARASKQYRDGVFRNTSGATPRLEGGSAAITRDFLLKGGARRPRAPLPVHKPHEAWTKAPSSSGLRVTWLGHSTALLESDGVRVLTDPVFGERASPVPFAGPKRFHPVPASVEELPPLDAVLLSHDHYDHLCAWTMRSIAARRVPIVTSLGVGAHLEELGIDAARITELDWWEEHVVPTRSGKALSFTATPAQHFSGRGLGDRNGTLWSSWVIATERRRLFFSGDTGLTDEFRAIGQRFAPFDVVMLEIGAYHQAWGSIHLGPENALRAFEWLGGGTLLPVHWGTFDLALHAWDEPAETLVRLADEQRVRVVTPELGRPFEPAHAERPSAWWRRIPRSSNE
jgi:L-ascorbate metabolism protein UlaG (beta-lactamase superfamily)